MNELKIIANTFTAEEYITLWNAVWDGAPSREQTEIALVHSIYRIGRMLINDLLGFIRTHGVPDTEIFVELCAMPDKIPFYEKFGFKANEAQRLRIIYRAE